MPKIIHMSSAHPSLCGRIFYKECCSLSELGYEVVYIVPRDIDHKEPYKIIQGVKIKYIKKYRSRALRFSLGLFNMLISSLKEKGNIYHFHDPDLLIVGILLSLLRKKVVYDIHELYSSQVYIKDWIPHFLKKLLSHGISATEKIGLKFFSAGVCAAPSVTEQFKRQDKLIECNNYPILRSTFNKPELNIPTAIYAGNISKARGIVELVETTRYFEKSELQLILLGDFSTKTLYDEISKLPEWPKINYLGKIDPTDVHQVISQCSFGLSLLHPAPNYINVIPTKIFEYMMASLPIVTSNFKVLSQFITKYRCGLCVDPLNSKEIAEAIRYLIDHPHEAKEMGMRGRHAVEKEFNWSHEAKKLDKLYQSIL